MIAIIGPTATGKTNLAAAYAAKHNCEIISADSRQVYQGLDIGSGKDLNEYVVRGKTVPYHLIDIVKPGDEYNLFRYQNDFLNAYAQIVRKNKTPLLCGGTGLYIDAVLKGYRLLEVPENKELRKNLIHKPTEEKRKILKQYKTPHNTTDTNDPERLTRAIEIQDYYANHQEEIHDYPKLNPVIFGIYYERQQIRERISERLYQRFENGMIEEVKSLLDRGIKADTLKFFGLEYRFVTQYVLGEIPYKLMFSKLKTAIHQFAKRQMTWFRKMERQGTHIHWLDGNLSLKDKVGIIETFTPKP